MSSPIAGISVIDKQPGNKNVDEPHKGKAVDLSTSGTGDNDGAYLKKIEF